MSLGGAYALVTGGGRGIGRAISLEFARQGANVAINYAANAAAAEETAEMCRAFGVDAFPIQADMADPAACQSMVEAILSRFGRLDILVNNAGIIRNDLAVKISEENWDAVLDTNLKGPFFCIKAAIPAMKAQKFGRIINMASTAGIMGNVAQANYSASKAGLIGMTKALAKELARYDITVNAIAPGFIATDMVDTLPKNFLDQVLTTIPLGRFGQPEDVARAVAFLAGEGGRYITGQVIHVDGGQVM